MSVLPKFIYRFNTIPIKIPAGSFEEKNTLIVKFLGIGNLISQNSFEKKKPKMEA
jgi:hypothetical protein